MTIIIGVVSQKGGVGKSTITRGLAREFSVNEWSVKVADLDAQQKTTADWHAQRLASGQNPVGSVEVFGTVRQALREADNYDLLILDGPARASEATLEIAKVSDIVIQPSGACTDDLKPAVLLFHELTKEWIPQEKLYFALTRVGTDSEIKSAKNYIEKAGYHVLDHALPERPSYRETHNAGLAITETRYATLRAKAEDFIQSIVDTISS